MDIEASPFLLSTDYIPRGDQPQAIEELVEGIDRGDRHQTLLGVTGSGKTFTVANVIARTGRPALVLAPNKTLAAQLYDEFKELFPDNAVEYFVSYYDYYQPEAYLPTTDTFIEKDSSINDEIDRQRHQLPHQLVVLGVAQLRRVGHVIQLVGPANGGDEIRMPPARALLTQRPSSLDRLRDGNRAVPVRVGLDRQQHSPIADAGLDGPEVGDDVVEVDPRMGRVQHEPICSPSAAGPADEFNQATAQWAHARLPRSSPGRRLHGDVGVVRPDPATRHDDRLPER